MNVVQLSTPPDRNSVKLQSPSRALLPGNTYTFCIWMRLSSPATAPAHVNMLNALSYKVEATKLFTPTQSWQQLCLENLQANNVSCYFTVSMGSAIGVYLMDDASLTYGGPAPP